MGDHKNNFFDPLSDPVQIAKNLIPQIPSEKKLAVVEALCSQLGIEASLSSKSITNKTITAYTLLPEIDLPAVREQCYALLVGIGHFQESKLNDSEYTAEVAINDVSVIKKALVEHCRYSENNISILVNENATLRKIQEWFAGIIHRSEMAEQIIIYLSSHGKVYISGEELKFGDGKSLEYSFIVHDTNSSLMTAQGMTSLTADQLVKLINEIKADEKVLMLDTCFCGRFNSPPSKRSGNHAYLLSCDADQTSWVHSPDKISIFTKYLAEGLSGEARVRSSKEINISDLHDYVRPAVMEAAMRIRQQNQEPALRVAVNGRNIRLV